MAPPNNRLLIALGSRANLFWYRQTGGLIGGSFRGAPILLLTTTGRRSGRRRTTPLLYLRDGDDLVVVGSNAGDDRDPNWLRNLRHDPAATVEIGATRQRVRARVASAEERARLWPSLNRMYPDYDAYTKRTSREIPVVILRPAS